MFCSQTFCSAVEKDDHILEHFAQETCGDCNRNLIRIGANLYTLHETRTCIKTITKCEKRIEPCFVDNVPTEAFDEDEIRVKAEPVVTAHNQYVSLKRLPPLEMPPLVPIGAVARKTEQTIEQQNPQTDECYSDEEYSEDVHSTTVEAICENEIQIKGEPTFDVPDQPEVDQFSQRQEMASTSKHITENVVMEENGFGGVNNIESSQHFPSDSMAVQITGKMEHQIKPSTSNNKEQSQCRNKRKPYECNICGRILSRKSLLDGHKVRFHSVPGTQYCAYCTKIFETADELAHHLPECQQKSKGGPRECGICKKNLTSRDSLRNHMKSTHNLNNKFKCNLCRAYFTQESALQNHHAVHDKGVQLPCNFCERIYSRKDTLKRHMVRKHNIAGKNYCSLCVRIFATENELDEHKIVCKLKNKIQKESRKTMDKNASYECYLCHKLSQNHSSLLAHFRFKHSVEAIKFKCKICGKGFWHSRAFDNHTSLHQRSLNDKKCMCTVCGKYLSATHLQSHMLLHMNKKPFKCSYDGCEKYFRTKTNIVEHMRSHTGEKPFQCTIDGCNRRFSYAVDHRRHKFKVHGIFTTKFPCLICNEVCPENALLKSHMKKHNIQTR